MKRLKICLFLGAILIIMFCLTGCDNNKNTSNTTSTGNKTTNSNSSNANTKNNEQESSSEEIDVESINFVASAEKQVAAPEKGETIAIMHIKNYGDIKLKFFSNVAPKAVENFITHAKNGYYNGVIFHRVINDFMIQGGDPTGTGTGGDSIWGKDFEDEFSYDLVPYRGALCMANAGSNTNGSQFFIEQAKYDESTATMLKQYGYPENILEAYKKYGGSLHLFGKHTVFGQVIEGMDVVDKIAATKTDDSDKPLEQVVIESIDIVEY
ncbi:MAG: peptidylprolyl isomerase [Clostridia bacterium]|nr:peptidylprolyl isomerase [Clostridia bacterium]